MNTVVGMNASLLLVFLLFLSLRVLGPGESLRFCCGVWWKGLCARCKALCARCCGGFKVLVFSQIKYLESSCAVLKVKEGDETTAQRL